LTDTYSNVFCVRTTVPVVYILLKQHTVWG